MSGKRTSEANLAKGAQGRSVPAASGESGSSGASTADIGDFPILSRSGFINEGAAQSLPQVYLTGSLLESYRFLRFT